MRYKTNFQHTLWHLLPIFVSQIYLWWVILMDVDIISAIIGGAVTLIVCVISLFAAQISDSRKMKKDSERIKETSSAVSDLRPVIGLIHQNGETTKTNVALIQKDTAKIDSIAAEISTFKQMRSDLSGAVKPEVILASMTAVFEENASLRHKLEESEKNANRLVRENEALASRIRALEKGHDCGKAADWEMEL